MIIVPILQANFEIVEDFEKSSRGSKGFGSSGINWIKLFFLTKSFFKFLDPTTSIDNFLFTSVKRVRGR